MFLSPSHAFAAPRWEDAECDVSGYDYFSDDHFTRSCRKVGINWVEPVRSRNGLSIDVKLDDGFPNGLARNERQALWLNTNRNPRPEFVALIRYDDGDLYRVRNWRSSKRLVSCDDDRYNIGIVNETMSARIPRSCLGYREEVRMNVRSLDRYDSGRSYRQDYFPAKRTWSPRF
jgi:hypothetical protein